MEEFIIIWGLLGLIAAFINKTRKLSNYFSGFVVFIFGPIGLIFTILSGKKENKSKSKTSTPHINVNKVSNTKDEGKDKDLCGDYGGITSDGTPCQNPAGMGTIKDEGKCHFHIEDESKLKSQSEQNNKKLENPPYSMYMAIDFETANYKRVSACSIGFAKIVNNKIVESEEHLINPVGGHKKFHTKIHGISPSDTKNKNNFGDLYSEIKHIFNYDLVAHSQFDKQVLNALFDHFGIDEDFNYYDTCQLAKANLPNLNNHKLPTVADHFGIDCNKHHSAKADAIACGRVFTELEQEEQTTPSLTLNELIEGILADNKVDYKEAYQLLYWLEDHPKELGEHTQLYRNLNEYLKDDELDKIESNKIKSYLEKV